MAAKNELKLVKTAAPPKHVTSYDVARKAGVSQSAVSRYFTPGASVSKPTRERIMRAVEALGYRPNAIARSLITQRSNMVAIIVTNTGFHPEFTAQLSNSFTGHGLHILLFTLDHERDAERVLDEIWQFRVDGVIAAVRLPEKQIALCAERRIPLVFLNRLSNTMPINTVCCDQLEGERLLVDRLVAAGHRSFGIVQGPDDSAVSLQRVEEALRRLTAAGVSDVSLARGEFDYRSGRRAFHSLVEDAGKAPEAVICANDMMAIGCVDAARHDFGLAVPEAVSVVGFDGHEAAGWASYDLVTIRQPVKAMAEAAAEMLLARIDNPELVAEKRMFTGDLIEGSSARLG